jgi:hypothetical protein
VSSPVNEDDQSLQRLEQCLDDIHLQQLSSDSWPATYRRDLPKVRGFILKPSFWSASENSVVTHQNTDPPRI